MTCKKIPNNNPYHLTQNQHIFPQASIKRFYKNGGVSVILKKNNYLITKSLPAQSSIFCANRCWNQKTESGQMIKEIENKYCKLANEINNGCIKNIDGDDTKIVTDMFLLWHRRAYYHYNPIEEKHLEYKGVTEPSWNPTEDENQALEKAGIMAIQKDNDNKTKMLATDITGISIHSDIIKGRIELSNKEWGILTAQDGEFIVPDVPDIKKFQYCYLPLSPTICLSICHKNHDVDRKIITKINKFSINVSEKYYFAKDFNKSPW